MERALQDRYGGLVMAGDGINDARPSPPPPSGRGHGIGRIGRAALEPADVAFMGDDLSKRDRVLAEIRRLLRPGAIFAGSDSRVSLAFRLAHIGDTMVLVDPDTLADRLVTAGFEQIRIDANKHAIRFQARVPPPEGDRYL